MDTTLPDTGPTLRVEPVRYDVEPTTYDLCLTWITEDDAGFVEMLDAACHARNLSLLQVTPANLERACRDLMDGKIKFRAFFDRGSDESPDFEPIIAWARTHDVFRVNPFECAERCWDKATMHTMVSKVAPVPYTVFLPPYETARDLPAMDLGLLGPTFTIKPVHGGGGRGVVVVATSLDQLPAARQQVPDDSYMIQARVVPARIEGRTAWFRVIYSAGKIYPSWWDFDTRNYQLLTVAEEAHYHLDRMLTLIEAIADVCELQLFSTEVAVDSAGQFVVVDYVNDPIDLTLQSKKADGVPDDLVRFIAEDLADLVGLHLQPS